jgi:hypothetical protein
MIQATIIQDTNYLIPNKEHKNFTDSVEQASVGSTIFGKFQNISGLRKGKSFDYRLFVTKNGKILYANCVKAENIPSEIISNADNLQSASKDNINLNKPFNYSPYLFALSGALVGYLYGKKKNANQNNLMKYIAVGTVGAYGIYLLIEKN